MARAKASLARKGVALIYTAFPPSTSEPRTGMSELHRTATAVSHAAAGKFLSQGTSLVVAARPSAGRSPPAARGAKVRSSRMCQLRMGWGTLQLVKYKASCLSNAKVPRPSHVGAWLGHERKGGSSKAASNPFIEGTAKGLRPSSAPHVER